MKISFSKATARLRGYLLFPASNALLNRRGILRQYRSLLKSQWFPPEELRQMQLEKLRRVLTFASLHVPFYRAMFARLGLSPADIRSLDDLAAIPPLTRDDLIRDAPSLVDERVLPAVRLAEHSGRPPGEPLSFALFRSHRVVRNTSSGSTGWPTVFYDDGTRSAVSWAHELRLRKWFGVNPGAPEARLMRLAGHALTRTPGRLDFRRLLWNQLMLPGTNLSIREYRSTASAVRRFSPAVIWGYTSALMGLAQYLDHEGVEMGQEIKPQLLISWAAPLYDHERVLLERVFRSHVTNVYGSREVGHIAALCPHGSLHVNQENLIVETDRDSTSGHAGELLVTTLDSSPMPFIRYRMGDLGILTDSLCPCGRGLQVIQEFVGRTGEVFVTRDGRTVSPNVWCRIFMAPDLSGAVRRFQVFYTVSGDIRVHIERGPRFTAQTHSLIEAALADRFHPATSTAIEYVSEIRPQISGKYQMIVRE
jgi:phenylacetate-CoA ligase